MRRAKDKNKYIHTYIHITNKYFRAEFQHKAMLFSFEVDFVLKNMRSILPHRKRSWSFLIIITIELGFSYYTNLFELHFYTEMAIMFKKKLNLFRNQTKQN